MGSVLTKRDNLQLFRLSAALLILVLAGLGCSGRIWPGTKYPIGILLIAVWYGVAGLGYTCMRHFFGPIVKGRFRRLWSFVEWIVVLVCLLGRFWWGWYVVLGVFCDSAYAQRPNWDKLRGKWGWLQGAGWLLSLFFIAYILLNKPFFSQQSW